MLPFALYRGSPSMRQVRGTTHLGGERLDSIKNNLMVLFVNGLYLLFSFSLKAHSWLSERVSGATEGESHKSKCSPSVSITAFAWSSLLSRSTLQSINTTVTMNTRSIRAQTLEERRKKAVPMKRFTIKKSSRVAVSIKSWLTVPATTKRAFPIAQVRLIAHRQMDVGSNALVSVLFVLCKFSGNYANCVYPFCWHCPTS